MSNAIESWVSQATTLKNILTFRHCHRSPAHTKALRNQGSWGAVNDACALAKGTGSHRARSSDRSELLVLKKMTVQSGIAHLREKENKTCQTPFYSFVGGIIVLILGLRMQRHLGNRLTRN